MAAAVRHSNAVETNSHRPASPANPRPRGLLCGVEVKCLYFHASPEGTLDGKPRQQARKPQVQIINVNVPSTTGSVQLQWDGVTICAKLNSASKTTETGFYDLGDEPLSVPAFTDGACTGAPLNAGVS
ncbi:hypothetical protein [Streptomyces sp. 4F14]|uniref:hypothetical protein n=1 Tax=Streptomyces sp. 4F14 TaxID=3394380 RepID=UPI003A8A79B4